VSIVIPAFEETATIRALLSRIRSVLSRDPRSYEVIVVVDYSPREGDATCREALLEKEAMEEAGIGFRCILRRYERGLASAVARGFDAADGRIVVVMDADGQHPPEKIPELVSKVESGVDVSVASRFEKGSRIEGLPWYRYIMSKLSVLLLRKTVCGASKTSDPLSGFFAVAKEKIPAGRLKPRGYKILLEILGRAPRLRVADIPFVFGERYGGSSKLNLVVALEGLVQLVDLSRIHVFALVGLLGMIVNLGVMALLLRLLPSLGLAGTLAVALASIGGIVASITSNFTLHELVTFRTRCRRYEGRGCLYRYVRYFLVSLLSILITVSTAVGFELAGLDPLLGQAVGIILGFTANWLLSAAGIGGRVEPVWKCEWGEEAG